MPIIKETVTPTDSTVTYHKAVKLEVDLKHNVASVLVQSYSNESSAISGKPASWNWSVDTPLSFIQGMQDIATSLEKALIASGGIFEGGFVVVDTTDSLQSLKYRKMQEVTVERLKADSDHFIYTYTDESGNSVSKDIRTGNKDMIDLLTTNSYVTLFGEFDEDWPGGWKAIDNTYVAITTLEQWKEFFKCMYKTGIANFKKSQMLKAQIDAAATVEEVNAISW